MRYSLLSVALLLAASSASPLPGVDQPITDEQYAKISARGLDKREILDARDDRKNCGKTLNGAKAGGDGIWCPVDQYLEIVNRFCDAYAGHKVDYKSKISHKYGVSLTNEYDQSVRGPAGHVICEFFFPVSLPDFFSSREKETQKS